MKTSTPLFVAFSFILSLAYSEAGTQPSTFQKTYGTAGNESGNSITPTSDGGFLMLGNSGTNILFIKADALGNVQIQKTFGGAGNDYGNSVAETVDGGYLILARTNSFGAGNDDAMVIKLDASGNVVWAKTYGLSNYEQPRIIRATKTGEILIAGTTNSAGAGGTDIMLLELDANGNILWQKAYGGNHGELPYQIDFTADGGLAIVGFRHDYVSQREVLLMKTGSTGTVQWAKVYRDGNWNIGQGIDETVRLGSRQVSGGEEFYISGYTTSYGAGAEDIFVLKADSIGNILWSNTYGGSGTDVSRGVVATASGLLVSGFTTSFGSGGGDIYLLQLDFNGNLLGSHTYGGAGSDMVVTEATDNMLQFTDDGGMVMLSSSQSFGAGGSDIYLVKAATNGNSGCNETNATATQTGSVPFNDTTITVTVTNLTLAVGSPSLSVNTVSLQENVLCRQIPGGSCADALPMPAGNPSCNDSIVMFTEEVWFNFIADSTTATIRIEDASSSQINSLRLYSGNCGSLNLLSNALSVAGSDTLPFIYITGLTPGNSYFVKVEKAQNINQPVIFSLCIDDLPEPLTVNWVLTPCAPVWCGPNLIQNGDFETIQAGIPACIGNCIQLATEYTLPAGQTLMRDACSSFGGCGTSPFNYTNKYTISNGPVWPFNGTTTGECPNDNTDNSLGTGNYFFYGDAPSNNCAGFAPCAGCPAWTTIAWQQNVNVCAGVTYNFSMWFKKIGNQNAPSATLNIFINNAQQASCIANLCGWERVCFAWTAGVTPANIQIRVTGANAPGGYDFGIDDISFQRTPPVITFAPFFPTINCGSSRTLQTTLSNVCGHANFNWSPATGLDNPNTLSPVASPTTTTTYTITVTQGGCLAQRSVTINVIPVSYNFTFSDIQPCVGGSNGTIDMTVTGGAAPLAYSWSNGAATQDLSGVTAGTYTVTVTDAKGCTGTAQHTLTAVQALNLSLSSNNVTCNGAHNGTISVTVTGGAPDYTYSWASVEITYEHICFPAWPSDICFDIPVFTPTPLDDDDDFVNNLDVGLYCVTVTDGNGCLNSICTSITEPPTSLLLSPAVTNCTCFGSSDGAIDLTVAGGTAPYNYLWDQPIQPPNDILQDQTGLPAGSYSVSVTDATGDCAADINIPVSQPDPITVSFTSTSPSCPGYNDGTITATASGGNSGGYAYLWPTPVNQFGSIATGLVAGTYSVMVFDTKGCTGEGTFTLNDPAPLVLSATIDGDCPGGFPGDGFIDLTVTGGVSPYGYQWSTGQLGQDIKKAVAGNYTVTVTDGLGCTASGSFTVPVNPLPVVSITVTNNIAANCNESATAGVTGGTSPYIAFLWNDPLQQNTQTATGLCSGTYSVTVTDTKGCTAIGTITFVETPPITVTVTGTNVSCNGGSDGAATATVSGGGTSPFIYKWSNGDMASTVTGLAAGNYTVTVTDNNGFTATGTIVITQPLPITVQIRYGVVCPTPPVNPNFSGSAGAYPFGGVPPYAYVWSTFPAQYSQTATGLAIQTNYSVTVTDANGCSKVVQGVVIREDLYICHIEAIPSPADICSNQTAQLNAYPSTASSFLWSANTGNATTATVTANASGVYSVDITNPFGCIGTSCTALTNVNVFSCATTGPDLCLEMDISKWPYTHTCLQTVCAGGCSIINVQFTIRNVGTSIPATINGCTLNIAFTTPLPPGVVFLPNQSSSILQAPNITNSGGGISSMEWTNLCDNGFAATLTGNTYSLSFEVPADPACLQPPVDFSANSNISYSGGEAGACPNTASDAFSYTGPLDPNEKTITENEGIGICHTILKSDTIGYQISFQNVGTAPAVDVYIADTLDSDLSFYSVHAVSSSHNISAFYTLGTGVLQWFFNSINLPDSASDPIGSAGFVKFKILPETNIAAGTVITNRAAIIFDYNPPVITNTVFNTILDYPVTISASGSTEFCEGGSVIINAGTANGYLWSTGETTQSITATTPGLYSVQDASGCKAPSDTIAVTVNENPVVEIGSCVTVYYGYAPLSCDTLISTVTFGSPPYSYYWNTGETTADIIVCPAATANYTLTVTDANGCTGVDEVTVEVIDVHCGQNNDKVQICHYPPGNLQNPQDLCIDENAVVAHLTNHGDVLGSCGAIDPCASAKTASSPPSGGWGMDEPESALDKAIREVENRVTFEFVPNPVKHNAKIVYRIPLDARVSVMLYTISGKQLMEINRNNAEKNKFYVFTLDDFRFPDGVYVGVLSYGDKSYIKKVTVIRE